MKYFTRTWWQRTYEGDCTDEEANKPFKDYSLHIKQIAPKLPSTLLALNEISLHDGLFKAVCLNSAAKSVSMTLRCGDLQVGYFDLYLNYENALVIDNTVAGLDSIMNNQKYEIIYDEVGILEENRFEHGVLIYPEGELIIQFSDFTFSRRDVANRDSPLLISG